MKVMDTVRVVVWHTDMLPEWVEIFKYLGTFRVLNEGDEHNTLEFTCSHLTEPQARADWARYVAGRMEAAGINAVTAFPWPDDEPDFHNHDSDAAAYRCGCYE